MFGVALTHNTHRHHRHCYHHGSANLPPRALLVDAAEEDAAHDPSAAEASDAGGHQFLHADEARREGDTQALAPATEEQAASLEDRLQLHAGDDDAAEDGGGDDDDAAAAQPPEDEDMADADAAGPDQQADAAQGSAPRTWGGGSKAAKKPSEPDATEGEASAVGHPSADGDLDAAAQEEDRRRTLLESLSLARDDGARCAEDGGVDAAAARATAAGADADALAAMALEEEAGGDGGGGGDAEGSAAVAPLDADAAEALRQQLDAQLKGAAAAALGAAGDESLMRYGSEVWSRCESLTLGLASELTEQLRLILEPTLASKMAGDFKTGKRINMKKVWDGAV